MCFDLYYCFLFFLCLACKLTKWKFSQSFPLLTQCELAGLTFAMQSQKIFFDKSQQLFISCKFSLIFCSLWFFFCTFWSHNEKIYTKIVHKNTSKNWHQNVCRYRNSQKQQAPSSLAIENGWNRDKNRWNRRESNSLKLKIVQNYKENERSNGSPTDEIFCTPNTTLDADDDQFSTPIGPEFGMMKMKSMNNLSEHALARLHNSHAKLSHVKSISQSDQELFDTPVDLVKLRKEFVKNRFEGAKLHSQNQNESSEDVIDGFTSSQQQHNDENSENFAYNRHSLQTPKRVGNTKYIGADLAESHQLMKMRSMGMINDIMKNSGPNHHDLLNQNTVKSTKLIEKFTESNGKADENFKMPQNPLRKEKSSSCIDSMKSRGNIIYNQIR